MTVWQDIQVGNIKHKKAKEDANGQVFTKIGRKITVAAKEGGLT